MASFQNQREIDPFFEDAVNTVFIEKEKTAFVMDGPIGVGKTTNFLMRTAYQIAQCVKPIKKGKKYVRESLWAGVRESENSAIATFLQVLENSIFTPEIMSMEESPVRQYGSHPAIIEIKHDLNDGTILLMKIECHGFNNEKAANRLRTREYMGGLIPEMQGVPYHIFETLVERCGRWRTKDLYIEKKINGKMYRLTGVTGLAIVLCDVNIPTRPHELYTHYYDISNKNDLPTKFLTPPPPLLHFPVDKVDQKILDMYPVTRFEGAEVVWVPNPKIYNMTRHYEEQDENGDSIPWSGYKYWFKRLHNTDSHVRRYIIGIPDTVGGEAAVYNNFRNDASTQREHEPIFGREVFAGFDPGGHAAIVVGQLRDNNDLHWMKEFIVEPHDRVSTRLIFRDFFFPWCRKNLEGFVVRIVPDPASSSLGKSVMTGQEESVYNMIKDEIKKEMKRHRNVKYIVENCKVHNQATQVRIDSLGYFIDKGKLTADPKQCNNLISALGGGYQRKKLNSGVISDNIDKDNPYSHSAEAAQYVAVNLLYDIKKGRKNEGKKNNSVTRVRRKPRR